jgi:hypothetical protein
MWALCGHSFKSDTYVYVVSLCLPRYMPKHVVGNTHHKDMCYDGIGYVLII